MSGEPAVGEKGMSLSDKISSIVLLAAAVLGMSYFVHTMGERTQTKLDDKYGYVNAVVVEEEHKNKIAPSGEWQGLSDYVIKAKAYGTGDTLSIIVKDWKSFTKESLDSMIQKGTIVQFPRRAIERNEEVRETYFKPGDKSGVKYADRIKVMG